MQKMKTVYSKRQINAKLDKALKLLDEVVNAVNSGDLEMSPALHKKLTTRWKRIEDGRVKLHRYGSLEQFDKSMG